MIGTTRHGRCNDLQICVITPVSVYLASGPSTGAHFDHGMLVREGIPMVRYMLIAVVALSLKHREFVTRMPSFSSLTRAAALSLKYPHSFPS